MARNYPRFLFSNPQHTVSTGPFIVHCIKPRMLLKFKKAMTFESSKEHAAGGIYTTYDNYIIWLVEPFEPSTPEQTYPVLEAAIKWVTAQISTGDIVL